MSENEPTHTGLPPQIRLSPDTDLVITGIDPDAWHQVFGDKRIAVAEAVKAVLTEMDVINTLSQYAGIRQQAEPDPDDIKRRVVFDIGGDGIAVHEAPGTIHVSRVD